MDPPWNRPLNPVVATPYSPRGELPRTLVHEPLRGLEVFEAVSLVQIVLPEVRAMPVSVRTGLPGSMSKVTPVRAFPCAVVLGEVVFVSTTVRMFPEIVNSALPEAVALASGLFPLPLKMTPAFADWEGPRRATTRPARIAGREMAGGWVIQRSPIVSMPQHVGHRRPL